MQSSKVQLDSESKSTTKPIEPTATGGNHGKALVRGAPGNTGIRNISVAAGAGDSNTATVPGIPTKPGKSNAMIVSARQKGNPILKFVRNVPWEFGDIVPDYVMSRTSCALFLSLRYHQLNPNYIHERLKQLGHSYDVRVLLTQVDVKDAHHLLKNLAEMCVLADCTLLLAWSPEEAGRYLETLKAFENKPPDLIMERTESNYLGQVTDCMTTVRTVNKTDSMTLLTTFGCVENVINASEEDLSLCPGFGPQKAKRLHDVFHEPFLSAKKRLQDSPMKGGSAQSPLK